MPAGAEAILTGLAGIRPHPDGSRTIHPQPVAAGNISIHGLSYRGHSVDVTITTENCQVSVDGRRLSPGPDGTILAVPPRS
ncbi:hypothetical protein OG558_33725 [Kribbella sp. NBC_01510]|uniref:hypothetical protein n=1 Tax=Kribbella sp. NBC_01510 TaxID=2903581 RepID=UPI00386C0CEF